MSDGGDKSVGQNIRAILGVFDLPFAVLGGFGLFFVVSYISIAWAGLIPISLNRIAKVGPFLQEQASHPQPGNILLFGSSILVEGIDCDVLDKRLPPGHKSFNLGWTGASLRETILAIPAALRSHPAVVGLCIGPGDLFLSRSIAPERTAIAAWSGLTPSESIADLSTVLKQEETKPLSDSIFTQLLRFRALPLGALNSELNEVARPDLRYQGYITNFRSPWAMRQHVNPAAFDRQLADYVQSYSSFDMAKLTENLADSSRLLAWNLRRIREGSSKAVVVISPQYPILLDLLKKKGFWDAGMTMLKKSCQEGNGIFLDHSDLVSAENFSDPVHPSKEGRLIWSDVLGRALAEQIR